MAWHSGITGSGTQAAPTLFDLSQERSHPGDVIWGRRKSQLFRCEKGIRLHGFLAMPTWCQNVQGNDDDDDDDDDDGDDDDDDDDDEPFFRM